MALSLPGERSLAAATPSTPLHSLFAFWAKVKANRARRIALKRLLELEPERLNDLGISRSDIYAAMEARSGRQAAMVLTSARARSAKA
ncbi:protein of unknown function [Devosia crocina]|uniref:YjiS-like domain-containing protein n=1 Tax=Devosia crocina TaxID=429728 RepID=A0A1I7NNU1_9HYPH|nr:DUF1127 domain-containing protein [Devosia crocina]SFV36344.1 protein of unknown function [Devosia crocina]